MKNEINFLIFFYNVFDYLFATKSTHDGVLHIEGALILGGMTEWVFKITCPRVLRAIDKWSHIRANVFMKISMIADHPLDQSASSSRIRKFFHFGTHTLDFRPLGLVGVPQPKFKSPTGDPPSKRGHPEMAPQCVQMLGVILGDAHRPSSLP